MARTKRLMAIGISISIAMFSLSPNVLNAQAAYDAELANRLNADENGMRVYVVAFLKAGPNRNRSEDEARRLQAAHRANIRRLVSEGKVALAGPFEDAGELRGIYIFAVGTVAEAEALTNTDPAIQAGQLVMELHRWYGSAALMTVNDVHTRIEKH